MLFKRKAISVEGLVDEIKSCLVLIGINPVDYLIRQKSRGAANFSKELRTADGEKRRRTIVIKLIEDGTIPKHRFEYLSRTEEFPEKLNAWYKGEKDVG